MPSRYETEEYSKANPDWHEEDGAWKAAQILRMLERHDLPQGRIVDVGCGTGRILRELRSNLPEGVSFTGYDIAPLAIERARRHACERLNFHNADFLDRQHDPYDLLLLMDVFEHVPDYLGFLERLRPHAGHFIFHVPLDMNILHVALNHQVRAREQAGHLHYFTKDTALMTLEDAGYSITDWFYTPVFKTARARRSFKKRLIEVPRQVGGALFPDFWARFLGGYSVLILARPRA